MNGEDFKRLEQIVFDFKEEVKAEFRHQIVIQSEHFQHKLDIVIEGHEVLRKEIQDTREELSEKIQFVDFKVETLSQEIRDTRKELQDTRKELSEKIQAVTSDLKAHRQDTEAHPKIYQVKE